MSPRTHGTFTQLGLFDAIAIVAGTVIGSGIFLVPNSVAKQLPSLAAVLLVWLTGGLLSLFGALALGELGAAFPGAGGLYVYLRQAYGKFIAFLYGWGLLTLIHSGSIATLAVAFRIYLAQIVPLTVNQQKLTGVACVLVLTGLNCLGLRSGKGTQNIFTVAKFGGLALMIGLLFLRGNPHMLRASFWPRPAMEFHPASFGIALIAVLWAYEGWHVVSFTAGEFRHSQRDLPRGLFYGTLIVVVTYILANIASLRTDSRADSANRTSRGHCGELCVGRDRCILHLGADPGVDRRSLQRHDSHGASRLLCDGQRRIVLPGVRKSQRAFSCAGIRNCDSGRLGCLLDLAWDVPGVLHLCQFHGGFSVTGCRGSHRSSNTPAGT